jgi:hydrogenase/urease accessory protein HupE
VFEFPLPLRLCVSAVTLALSLAVDRLAAAHDLGVARVELREKEGGRYEMDVAVHAGPEIVDQRPELPTRCTLDGPPSVFRRPGVAVLHFTFTCAGRPLGPGDVLRLPWKREGAFVAARWHDGTSRSRFFGSDPQQAGDGGILVDLDELRSLPLGPADVARRYFLLGVEHILTGWDHLAFVFCLCLLARGWRLLKLVTGFTLGHSLSLALAAFDVVRLPSPPTEACIALSIAFVAREALLPPESRRHGTGLVLAFGLLHGLGFAGALKEVGISPAELLLGLATFNLGVEAGQLIFVACVLTLLVLGSRVPYAALGRSLSANAVGMAAVFWILQRIDLFSPLAAALSVPILLTGGAVAFRRSGRDNASFSPGGLKRVQFFASATDSGHAGSSRLG